MNNEIPQSAPRIRLWDHVRYEDVIGEVQALGYTPEKTEVLVAFPFPGGGRAIWLDAKDLRKVEEKR